MTLKVQIIIGLFLGAAIIAIVNMIRKKSLELRYALLWILIVVALLMLDIFPSIMDSMSRVVGISSPVNMIFFMGFCFSLGVIFILTVVVARMSEKIRQLSQSVALISDREQIKGMVGETVAASIVLDGRSIAIAGDNGDMSANGDKETI